MSNGRDQQIIADVIQSFLTGNSAQYNLFRSRIARYVQSSYSAGPAEREDLTSEIISLLLNKLRDNQFKGTTVEELNGYILGIARHRLLQVVEKRARREAIDADREAAGQTEDRNSSTLFGVSNKDLAEKIYARLEPECRLLLILKFAREMTNDEIAQYLKKSKNAVSTAISRCVKKAKDLDLVREILYQERRKSDLES